MTKKKQKEDMSQKDFQEKVMERVDEKMVEDYKFLMIGGNIPSVSKDIIELVNSEDKNVAIFELINDEMRFITHSRSQVRAEETAVNYINDPKNIEFAKQQSLEFTRIFFSVDKDENVEEFIGGTINKKKMKRLVNASWKQLNEAINNLDLFGMVEWVDDKKENFRLHIDKELILQNKINEVEQLLKFAGGKVMALNSERKNMNADSKKLMTRLMRNFKTERNWNLNK